MLVAAWVLLVAAASCGLGLAAGVVLSGGPGQGCCCLSNRQGSWNVAGAPRGLGISPSLEVGWGHTGHQPKVWASGRRAGHRQNCWCKWWLWIGGISSSHPVVFRLCSLSQVHSGTHHWNYSCMWLKQEILGWSVPAAMKLSGTIFPLHKLEDCCCLAWGDAVQTVIVTVCISSAMCCLVPVFVEPYS